MFGWVFGWIKRRKFERRVDWICAREDEKFIRESLRSEPLAPQIETDAIRCLVEEYDERMRQIDERVCRRIIADHTRYIGERRAGIRENNAKRHGFNIISLIEARRTNAFLLRQIASSEKRIEKALEALTSKEISGC